MAEARTLGQGERRSSKAGHRVGFDFRVGAMGDLKKNSSQLRSAISDQAARWAAPSRAAIKHKGMNHVAAAAANVAA